MEPLPRLYLPTTIDNIRHFSTPVSMASEYQNPITRYCFLSLPITAFN